MMENYHSNQQDNLISIIIPCYNHGQYLKETIASVKNQTYRQTEIIIVNDGSTDRRTLKVLDELARNAPALQIINQPNQGLAAARNAGIQAAKGAYILPLDADDLIAPVFLERTAVILNNQPQVGFVYTWVKYFGATTGIWQTPPYNQIHLLAANLCVATALFRRQAFDQGGGYQTDMRDGFEDWDFWIALSKHGWQGYAIPEPLFFYRQHWQGSMLGQSQKKRAYLIEKIIEHHQDIYQKHLTAVLVAKDALFFEAHTRAATQNNNWLLAGCSTLRSYIRHCFQKIFK